MGERDRFQREVESLKRSLEESLMRKDKDVRESQRLIVEEKINAERRFEQIKV